jgi:hypothetical protein
MLLQLAQPTLVNVFQLSKYIKMNMVEEWIITLEFNNENLKNASTSSVQQSCGQFNKVVPQKTKGAKLKQSSCTLYFVEQGEKTIVGNVVGLIRKKIILILFKPLPPTLSFVNLFFITRFMIQTIVS